MKYSTDKLIEKLYELFEKTYDEFIQNFDQNINELRTDQKLQSLIALSKLLANVADTHGLTALSKAKIDKIQEIEAADSPLEEHYLRIHQKKLNEHVQNLRDSGKVRQKRNKRETSSR